ncbi:BgTH12-01066 [Blumeria graminis f. sp. triticale]|uniref:BgTH12-01066 n=1 Tax=Blumeria graminis f. sp. triticale TaxID=1689686 RepID=A0A9W4D7K9_BLUGR|nr:BgTH12-01066 [Blumeria graminis f. sp. triticale]
MLSTTSMTEGSLFP